MNLRSLLGLLKGSQPSKAQEDALEAASAISRFSVAPGRRPAVELDQIVREKLGGKAHFTRRRSAGTRASLYRLLTQRELAYAQARGWL